MNAPPNIDPVTAHSVSDIVHWLINDTRDEAPTSGYSRQAGDDSCFLW
jgi:hypothetical protein